MSVKKDVYQAIKTALTEITEIRNVRHYNGQDLTNFQQDISSRFPQAWIQLTSIDWQPSELVSHNENRTRQQKSANVQITVYLGTFSLNEDDETFESDLDLIDLIYRKLTMLDGANFTPLQRVSESDIPTNNNVRMWAQVYDTMLTEYANADNEVDAAPVALILNAEQKITTQINYSEILSNDLIIDNSVLIGNN